MVLVQFNSILVGNVLHINMMKNDFICQARQKISKMETGRERGGGGKVFLKLLYEKDS